MNGNQRIAESPARRHAESDNMVQSFRVNFPQAALDDLSRRLLAPRWPDKETAPDRSQGAQLAEIQELARCWGSGYDWRKAEAKLNALLAITVFSDEAFRAQETWARRAFRNLIYFREVDVGGHFAAWKEPGLFAAELRAAFRSLR